MSATDIWTAAAQAADLTLSLPGGTTLFLRRIPAGSFLMGSRGAPSSGEEPCHRVVFSKPFFLGTFVVTQEQWSSVAEAMLAHRDVSSTLPGEFSVEPGYFKNDGARRPVEQVSWDDATAWLAALRRFVKEIPPGLTARLPTEAEWEYACRAGSETDYYSGDGEAALAEVGWYDGNSGMKTHAVDEPVGGSVEEHPLGLFGMHGNVFEWCRDGYDDNRYRKRADGVNETDEAVREAEDDADNRQLRVVRGGSWLYSAADCRSAFRLGGHPGNRSGGLGFRLCLAPGPAAAEQPETGKAEAETGARAGGRSPEATAPGDAGAGRDSLDQSAMPDGFRGA